MKRNVLLAILVMFIFQFANAQWSGDPQVSDTKVCTNSAAQVASQIIPDGSGGAIIFWIDSRNGGDGDIYYNKLNATGNAVWSPFSTGLSLTNTGEVYYIDDVISDGSGGAFIIWETSSEVLVQHVDNTGTKTWASGGISMTTTGSSGFICSDGNGGVIITWADYRNDLTDFNPRSYVQRVNSAGSKVWAAGGVDLVTASGYSGSIGITPDGAGGAIIATEDTRNSSYDSETDEYDNIDIYAQRINASGSAVWAAAGVPVCTQARNQVSDIDGQHPVVISDGAGGAVIAWDDYRNDPNNGNSDPFNEDVFCQRLNASGVAQWTANGVALSTQSNDDYEISLMPDGSGGAVAAWYDEGSSAGIYVQKINGSGTVQWTANGIAVASEIYSFSYTASPDATNSSILLTWVTNGADIQAQQVNVANGSLGWGSGGTLVCGRSDYESEPAITNNGGSGAIISWTDDRNSGTSGNDIYANRVFANGTLPVTIINFEVSLQPRYISLQWSTATEVNSKDFNIQRSLDGINFETLTTVATAGNSNTLLKYRFDDLQGISLKGKQIFYRIIETDIDGKEFYSDVKKVKIPDAQNNLVLMNNPVKGEAILNYNCVEKDNVLIRVADHLGRLVVMKQLQVSAGTNQITLPTANIANGIYEVELTSNKDHVKVRMLKD